MRMTKMNRPSAEDVALAQKVAAWMEQLSERENLNDYMSNLATFGRVGMVNKRGIGLVASAINAYLRDTAPKTDPSTSTFFGNVGERYTIRVQLVNIFETTRISYMGDEEASHVHKFRDEAGNVFTWFAGVYLWPDGIANGSDHLQPGDTWVWIRGTVKAHKEFRGAKETTLNRVELTDDPSVKKAKVKRAPLKGSETPVSWPYYPTTQAYRVQKIARPDGTVSYERQVRMMGRNFAFDTEMAARSDEEALVELREFIQANTKKADE